MARKPRRISAKSWEYFLKSRDQFHFATLDRVGEQLLAKIKERLPGAQVAYTGALRRKCNTLDRIDLLLGYDGDPEAIFDDELQLQRRIDDHNLEARTDDYPVRIYHFPPSDFGSKQFRYTAADSFLQAFLERFPGTDFKGLSLEDEVFAAVGLPLIPPELRESPAILERAAANNLPELVSEGDIKGVLHVHTTYSDGLNTLREMAEEARIAGYEYIGITDHSKSAFYANGLQPERVLAQMEEIDAINREMAPFRIFKGIESDILNDGSLDYDEEVLQQFDFIIASVHSNLRMDEEKATARILKAISNPYTTILGHPTGRLLLARPGYQLDHHRVIDACAAHGVSIELNANPHRLDLDWRHLAYAMEKGVKIAINPDAHSRSGIHDVKYGVASARKGGLTAAFCLNNLSVDEFEKSLRRGQ